MKYTGMTKEQIASKLADVPNYDANWVEIASTIMATHDVDRDILEQFSSEQLHILNEVFNEDVKTHPDKQQYINLICNPELNLTQMQIIATARSKGVKLDWIKLISDPSLPYAKSNYISQGMVDGFNMFDMIPDFYKYDSDQTYELFAGIKSNVDFKIYMDPDIPAEVMGVARHAMQLDMTVKIEHDTNGDYSFSARKKK